MVVKRRCVVCGTRFQQAAIGRPRFYCSNACRMVAYRARLRKRQLATRPEAGCDPLPLDGAEVADLDAIIEALERERRAMDSRERAADQALIDEGLESGRAAWRYIDPEVETLRTITDVPWFHIE